jgi:hypothetical protein
LTTEAIRTLQAGNAACSVGVAYPNEGSVFPGGLLPPTIMWPLPANQPQAGAYVHMFYEKDPAKIDYRFAVDGHVPGELVIPPEAWQQITARSSGDVLVVELKINIASQIQACTSHWHIARGNMTGTLYYYSNVMHTASPSNIFRMPLGGSAPAVETAALVKAQDPAAVCVGCHAMSARGTVLMASEGGEHPPEQAFYTYDMSSGAAVRGARLDNAGFGALTPDGKFILTLGNPDCTYNSESVPRSTNNMFFVAGHAVAKLLDVATGHEVATRGLEPNFYMWMPQFSPDGTKLVFNHAKPDPNRPGFTDRRELAVMDYDRATQTFSNLKVIVSKLGPEPTADYNGSPALAGSTTHGADACMQRNPNDPSGLGALPASICAEPCYPAWPFFTPDGKGVIFTLTDYPDFVSSFIARSGVSRGHLYYAELKTGQSIKLENAMRVNRQNEYGFDAYPTVLPVSIGGYAWLFWTSRRSWGTRSGGLGSLLDSLFGTASSLGSIVESVLPSDPDSKKLWVSAIKLQSDDNQQSHVLSDPSSPAFYLEGQGPRGNMRAFAALNPCHADGSACAIGVDCCAGFCSDGVCGTPKEKTCSALMEACTGPGDCCSSEHGVPTCIGGFCDVAVLQ